MPDAQHVALRLLKRLAMGLLVAVASLAGAAAWADPPGRVGRIADTQGTVWIFDAEQGEWTAAVRNRPLTGGDRLSVERSARAELQIGSATLRLDGGSDIEISELNDDRVILQLHNGSLALRLRSNESARDFAVNTTEGRFEPLGAGQYRIDRRDDGSFGGALAGTLRFEARDSMLELTAGQRAEFWIERGITHFSWAQLPNDRFDDWVAQQERQYERAARPRYVSPEMTGGAELDRYGDWDSHPEFGPIWYPRAVAPGWAPYRSGYWAYVQPWGYTWVDDAPWGFAPFHYGRWLWWQNRWAWCPGQVVARPVYAPALVAWIGGPNFSIGVNVGGGPAVGWVPLSPREVYRPTYNVTNVYVTNINTPHQRWREPQRRPDEPVRTGPVMYTNQGVPGGVTVVSQNVLRERQPVSQAVIAPVDPRTISRWQAQPAPAGNDGRGARNVAANPQPFVPPAPPERNTPAPRVIATPGGAVAVTPPAPGAPRDGGTPWGQRGQRPTVIATPGAAAPAQAVQPRPEGPPRGMAPQAGTPAQGGQPVRPVAPAQIAMPGAQSQHPTQAAAPAAPPAQAGARGAPVQGQHGERGNRADERGRPAPEPRREQEVGGNR